MGFDREAPRCWVGAGPGGTGHGGGDDGCPV